MSAVREVRAPTEQTDGTRLQLLRWLKEVGDYVAPNEPLLELETDKVTIEVPAPAGGMLREILKRAPEEVDPGEILGRIETAAEVAGHLPQDSAAAGQRQAPIGPEAAAKEARARLSPAVKRALAESGLDATALRGSGRGGRITLDDVRAHLAARARGEQAAEAPPTHTEAAAAPQAAPSIAPPPRRVPHTAMRKRIAAHMVESLLHTAPHVTAVFEADLGAVLEHRARHRENFERRGAPLTLTAYFIAACVDAIRAVPEANARWTADALEIFEHIDIGVGTALGAEGLVVPVLRGVERLDLFEIARQLGDLTARAREGRLQPADLRGGTFTVSNHGVSGSLLAAPIVINQPQSAILGVGRVEKRPVVVESSAGDALAIRPRCYVTLTIDHRVMDGFRGNRFLQTFTERLAAWK